MSRADQSVGGRRPAAADRGLTMAQSQPRAGALDGIDLSLRGTDSALPAPPAEVEREADTVAALPRLGLAAEFVARRQRSLWGDAWRRLIRNRLAVIGLVVVVLFIVLAALAPVLAPYDDAEVVDHRLARYHPSWTWPLGLDQNGRDIFSRLLYGARVSLVVGVLAQALVLAIGVPFGAIAGFYGGVARQRP